MKTLKPDPRGSLEEKCAWLKARMLRRRLEHQLTRHALYMREWRKKQMTNRNAVTILLLLAALPFTGMAAPSLTISGPSGLVRAGSTVTLTISVSGTAASGTAAIEFTVGNLPWAATPTIGAAGTAASKSVYCATVAGVLDCVVVGLQPDALGDGVLATIQVTLPRNLQTGTATLPLLATLGAAQDSAGNASAVTVGAGAPFALNTVSACDIDSSGTITQADFTAALPQFLGISACGSADLTSRGKCDILDAQVLAFAVSGGACGAK